MRNGRLSANRRAPGCRDVGAKGSRSHPGQRRSLDADRSGHLGAQVVEVDVEHPQHPPLVGGERCRLERRQQVGDLLHGALFEETRERELVPEQRNVGEISRTVARDARTELDEPDPADVGDTLQGLDLHASPDVDPTPREGRLRRARVDDGVRVLGADRPRRRADQPVEQAGQDHQQDGDQRDDERCGREATRTSPKLLEREVHTPTPAPVVASIESIRKTRRAATSALATPSTSRSTVQNTTAPDSYRNESPPSSA